MIEPQAIRDKAMRLWTGNRLLRDWLEPAGLFPYAIAAGPPSGRQLGEAYAAVKDWIAILEAGAARGYRIDYREVNHRQLGPQRVPAKIIIESREDCLRLIGKRNAFKVFSALTEATLPDWPALLPVFRKRPRDIIVMADRWEQCLAVCRYFLSQPRPGLYLRQLDIPSVDTKFIEQHSGILSDMLDAVLPAEAIDPTAPGKTAKGFAQRYGLAIEPPTIRLRILDSGGTIGNLRDLAVPLPELCELQPDIDTVFITENKINGLCFPDTPRAIVIFGLGYGVESLKDVTWLANKNVYYWGDIDTHGFRILNQLRSHLPHARSMLMDESTLRDHLSRCGKEPQATRYTGKLEALDEEEQAVYRLVLEDHLGESLRLEQERIGFNAVQQFIRAIIA